MCSVSDKQFECITFKKAHIHTPTHTHIFASFVQLIITLLLSKYIKQSNVTGFLVLESYINISSNVGMLDILMQSEDKLYNSKPFLAFGLS